jgi:hypothetical protein
MDPLIWRFLEEGYQEHPLKKEMRLFLERHERKELEILWQNYTLKQAEAEEILEQYNDLKSKLKR